MRSAKKSWIIQNKVGIPHRVHHYPSYPTATLHESGVSGPACDLSVDHSEVADGSRVDLLSASGGTLEELSLLKPSPVLGRSDPLKFKHNSRWIAKKKSPYKLSGFLSVTTGFLGGLTSQMSSGAAAAGLALPGVVAPVSIQELEKKNVATQPKSMLKKMLNQILLVQSYCLPLLLAISLI